MTREEFINWFFALTKNDIYEFGQLYDEVTKPHWISVDDELPKGFAIITNGDDVLVGKYNFKKGLWGVRNKTLFAYTLLPANWEVTHWMPLPSIEEIRGNQGETSPILSNLEKTGKDLKGGKK